MRTFQFALFISLALFSTLSYSKPKNKSNNKETTYCNPLNLEYRFSIEPLAYKGKSWGALMPGCDMDKGHYHAFREAADPSVIKFNNEYFLFASKSGGYWVSKDLLKWEFITTGDLPLEAYAPAALPIGDTLYFVSSGAKWIYKSTDPRAGKWEIANFDHPFPVDEWPKNFQDLSLFLDDDGRLYLYYGCIRPILAVELDYKNGFKRIGELKEVLAPGSRYAWNHIDSIKNRNMMLEGPWMTKYNGKYYLEYATYSDGSYVDGVVISSDPLKGFKPADSNPFSQKATGFVTGTGHGSTMKDRNNNYWHFTCVNAPRIKHGFERRLGMFPTAFDNDDVLHTNTSFGGYPHYVPTQKNEDLESLFTGWVLLSYKKPIEVSSSMKNFPAINAVDESLETYWSAESAAKNEWYCVDLEKVCNVNAIQVNFAEHLAKVKGRTGNGGFQYLVEYSTDKKNWEVLVDKRNWNKDLSHDYTELDKPQLARYVKISNVRMPDGMFAMYGFRIFGKNDGETPLQIATFIAKRDSTDATKVDLSWNKVPDAIGYNIRYGIAKDKLYMSRLVYADDTTQSIPNLNREMKYYYSIDVFNENGVTRGEFIFE
ncbi:family 43 glycosylhydrolase [uncultured Draconibacterium sp.]|uniref:family 43 glycosylhydrolase n=1 Tax=uncultured Draconibacterium sp. TaxID=1573823 RepID=UPI0032601E5C